MEENSKRSRKGKWLALWLLVLALTAGIGSATYAATEKSMALKFFKGVLTGDPHNMLDGEKALGFATIVYRKNGTPTLCVKTSSHIRVIDYFYSETHYSNGTYSWKDNWNEQIIDSTGYVYYFKKKGVLDLKEAGYEWYYRLTNGSTQPKLIISVVGWHYYKGDSKKNIEIDYEPYLQILTKYVKKTQPTALTKYYKNTAKNRKKKLK